MSDVLTESRLEQARALSESLGPNAPMPSRTEVLARIEDALTEVSALNKGKRWQMRIPVDVTDSDLVICAALVMAKRALQNAPVLGGIR